MKVYFRAAVLAALMIISTSCLAEPLRVVSTLSTYADIAKAIGGERVSVVSIAPAADDPHFIEPRPSDVLKVKRADLFIHSGLDLEAWREPLLDAAARSEVRAGGSRQLDLSAGIKLLNLPPQGVSRAEGDIHMFGNPHYWLNPRNALTISESIAAKLSEIDPDGRSQYQQNLSVWQGKLRAAMQQWEAKLKPYQGREVTGYHDGWPYLMDFAGLKMELFLEPKPGIAPSPRHLLMLGDEMKRRNAKVVVLATFNPEGPGRNLEQQHGSVVIRLAQAVGETEEASDYIALIDSNITRLVEALSHG